MAVVRTRVDRGFGVNEDLVWTDDDAAVVLDGATVLSERQYTGAESDARWYVEALRDELAARLAADAPLPEIAAEAIGEMDARLAAATDGADLDAEAVPAASGVLVRWGRGRLEYLCLGDCGLVVEKTEGVQPVIGVKEQLPDRRVVRELAAMRELDSVDGEEPFELVRPMLVAHRRLQNQPDGYWVFSTAPEAVDHATRGAINLEKVRSLAAFTDGFTRIRSHYDCFEDWGELVSYLGRNGLDRAVRLVREFERADPDCETYPRTTQHDDIAVVTVDFEA